MPISEKNIYVQRTRRLSTTLVVLPKIVISGHAGASESIASRLASRLSHHTTAANISNIARYYKKWPGLK
jgi:hypothetical protein